MNITKAVEVIQDLAQQGVRDFCLCPGARNAPFIEVLSACHNISILSFYDERSASFFALGRARRDRRPVVVCTTSGTAVAELLPATIEAHYTNTPLVLLTADRPKRLRGTGAPQAIEQSGLFQNYVERTWDLSVSDTAAVRVTADRPYHINVCFDEPLIDETVPSLDLGLGEPEFKKNSDFDFPETKLSHSLVIVAALTEEEREPIRQTLLGWDVPIFLEAASGLRGDSSLTEKVLGGGEKMVSRLLKSGEVENVLRIGDVPLGRFWRDLDQMSIPILSLSNKDFAGTHQSRIVTGPLQKFPWSQLQMEPWDWSFWRQQGQEKRQVLLQLLQEFPRSEAHFFLKFAESLSPEEPIYIGNSLPVRIWDLVSDTPSLVACNRGANGIDGQLSTALGGMHPHSSHRLVLGDLTTLYDFNGFWVASQLKDMALHVELNVVNNGGGQIFSRIFKNSLFRNEHELGFEAMAQFWGWNYSRVVDPNCWRPGSGLHLVEWQPCPEQSRQFWERYDQLWKT